MGLHLTQEEMAALVPESEGWYGGVYHWITSMGSFAALIGYAEVLWPDFVVHDDCILMSPVDAENHQAWMDRLGGNRTEVERVSNHVDLNYLIQNMKEDATDPQLTYVGRLLREMWEAKLTRDFPDRRFAVEHHDDPTNPDDNPLVTFSQIRDA